MLGDTKAGQKVIQMGQLVPIEPAKGDAVMQRGNRPRVQHDVALAQKLLSDLGRWKIVGDSRVLYLKAQEFGDAEALCAPIHAMLGEAGVQPESVRVERSAPEEKFRGEVRVVIAAEVFSNHSARMKAVLQQVHQQARPRAAGEGR
jgi:hypothetical protein